MAQSAKSHALKTQPLDIEFTGSQCAKCKNIVFPRKRVCPRCLTDGMEEVKLPREGKVFSLATLHNGSPDDFIIPYTNGYVELPNGLRVFGLIEEGEHGEMAEVGTSVSLSEIRKNERGQLLYIFRPSGKKEARK
jgi:uncharacterized OB-fold protein